jgi:hypothetical protein
MFCRKYSSSDWPLIFFHQLCQPVDADAVLPFRAGVEHQWRLQKNLRRRPVSSERYGRVEFYAVRRTLTGEELTVDNTTDDAFRSTRRLASTRLTRSPTSSPILRPMGKVFAAKQPRPLIDDFLTSSLKVGSSFIILAYHTRSSRTPSLGGILYSFTKWRALDTLSISTIPSAAGTENSLPHAGQVPLTTSRARTVGVGAPGGISFHTINA